MKPNTHRKKKASARLAAVIYQRTRPSKIDTEIIPIAGNARIKTRADFSVYCGNITARVFLSMELAWDKKPSISTPLTGSGSGERHRRSMLRIFDVAFSARNAIS